MTDDVARIEDSAMPPEFMTRLARVIDLSRRLDEPWRPHHATEVWIASLRAAGFPAKHAAGPWSGKYRAPLPFVVEISCPFGHRTEDRRDYAKVHVIVEDDGWIVLDPASPCAECDARSLERFLLTCPMCEVGDDGDEHDPEHDPFDWDNGDRSVVGHVLHELGRRSILAWARLWLERVEEAVELARVDGVDVGRYVRTRFGDLSWSDYQRRWAQEYLAVAAVPPLAQKRPAWTIERAVEWLDGLRAEDGQGLVPEHATQREALRMTEGLPDRPPKNVREKAQSARKARITGA